MVIQEVGETERKADRVQRVVSGLWIMDLDVGAGEFLGGRNYDHFVAGPQKCSGFWSLGLFSSSEISRLHPQVVQDRNREEGCNLKSVCHKTKENLWKIYSVNFGNYLYYL